MSTLASEAGNMEEKNSVVEIEILPTKAKKEMPIIDITSDDSFFDDYENIGAPLKSIADVNRKLKPHQKQEYQSKVHDLDRNPVCSKDITHCAVSSKSQVVCKKVKQPKTTQLSLDKFVRGSTKPLSPKKANKQRPLIEITNDDSFFDDYENTSALLSRIQDVQKNAKPSKRKEDRKKMHGFDCACCRDYYNALGLTEEEKAKRIDLVSRHRAYVPPSSTPPHFWEYRFPSTPECIQRGYIKESDNARQKRLQMEKEKLMNKK